MPDVLQRRRKIRWREYKTAAGNSPVHDYLTSLSSDDLAEVVAAMTIVAREGLVAARHLRGPLYEVRVPGKDQDYRVLFAPQGKYSNIFLALEAFLKRTQQTPKKHIDTALTRLRDWNQRAFPLKLRLLPKLPRL